MDSYDKYYNGICRVCLSYRNNTNMVCLIDHNGKNGLSFYGQAVQQFANVSIKINDYLPQSMCEDCLSMLKHAIRFKNKCEASDKKLAILFQQHKQRDSNLKEMIVDYSLFRGIFPQVCSNSTPETTTKDHNTHIDKKDSGDEDISDRIEDNINDIKVHDSADEVLDSIEQNLHHFSSSKSKNTQEVNQNVDMKRSVPCKEELDTKKHRRSVKLGSCICDICQKVLANKHSLKYHMQQHTGFSFICEHCGKGFPLNVYLQNHLVTRHGTGPYIQCSQCPFKAPAQFLMDEHVRLHTGERPFSCDKCGRTFRRAAIWKNHMLHHQEKKIQCPHCPKKFYRVEYMKAHCNSIHERMYVYMCHKCNTCYAKAGTVRKHLTDKHGIPREMQGKIVRINKGKGNDFCE